MLAVAIALALLIGRWADGTPDGSRSSAAPARAPAPAGPTDTPAPGASAAPPGPRPAPTAGYPPLTDAQLRELDAQWCSHGAQAYAQFQDSVLQSLEQEQGTLDAQQLDRRLAEWPAHRAKAQIQARVVQDWIAALQQRGDEVSLAIARFLDTHNDGALLALHRQAQTSRDPRVLALAASRSADCAALPGCPRGAATRWTEVEPSNLAAWLTRSEQESHPLSTAELAGTREFNSHQAELMLRLTSLPGAQRPGLFSEVEQQQLIARLNQPGLPPFHALMERCNNPVDAEQRAGCAQAAESLWQQSSPNLMTRTIAVALSRQLGLGAPWPQRYSRHLRVMATAPTAAANEDMPHGDMGCSDPAPWRARLSEFARRGEWVFLDAHAQSTASATPPSPR